MEGIHLARDKFRLAKRMTFDEEGAEMATPEAVAAYRARRLACDRAVDLCCGIGGDAIALARTCGHVVAVDRSQDRLDMARINCEAHGLDNVEFVCADALELDLLALSPNVAFADPSRRQGGRRMSRVQDTLPRTDRLVERMAGLPSACIEASMRLAPDDIPWDCEREYLSLDGKAHCLSLYFGKAKRCKRSAVVVMSEEIVVSPDGASASWREGCEPSRLEMREGAVAPAESEMLAFFHELNPAVAGARLEPELAGLLGFRSCGGTLTSEKTADSPFVKDSYEVLGRFASRNEIPALLRRAGAGKVVLRGRLDPQEQLKFKAVLEKGLSGKRKLHVFLDLGLVAESATVARAAKGQPL